MPAVLLHVVQLGCPWIVCSLLQVLHKIGEVFLELGRCDSLMSIALDMVEITPSRSSLLAHVAAVLGSLVGQPATSVKWQDADVSAGLAVAATVGEASVRQVCAKVRPLARLRRAAEAGPAKRAAWLAHTSVLLGALHSAERRARKLASTVALYAWAGRVLVTPAQVVISALAWLATRCVSGAVRPPLAAGMAPAVRCADVVWSSSGPRQMAASLVAQAALGFNLRGWSVGRPSAAVRIESYLGHEVCELGGELEFLGGAAQMLEGS